MTLTVSDESETNSLITPVMLKQEILYVSCETETIKAICIVRFGFVCQKLTMAMTELIEGKMLKADFHVITEHRMPAAINVTSHPTGASLPFL